jgi:cytochrome c peroxidase
MNQTGWHHRRLPPALPPVPADNSLTQETSGLGKMLFFDSSVSANGVISCATCRMPAGGG